MAGTVLTYGETMLRLNPAGAGERVVDCARLTPRAGGSESNVAVALSRLDVPARHATRLPAGPLGDRVAGELAAAGVDVGSIVRGGSRVGVYFTETGVGPRPSTVIYDRAGSSFSEGRASDYPESMWDGVVWLHVSGITPALSAHASKELLEIVDACPSGVRMSVDLNYRSALWDWTEGAGVTVGEVMWDLASRADVIFANECDLRDCLGLDVDEASSPERIAAAAGELFDRLPRLSRVAVSHRESHSASDNVFGGALFARESSGASGVYATPRSITGVVDRFGTGDAFAAGIIDGLISDRDPGECLEFAVALAALCHTVAGDHSSFSRADVERCVADGSGRVVR